MSIKPVNALRATLALALGLGSSAAIAKPKFAPGKKLKLTKRQYTPKVIRADVDGDGDLDFGTHTNYHGAKIGWLENTGKGKLRVRDIDNGVSQPKGLGIGDLDKDGDLDFVSSSYKGLLFHENLKKGKAFATKEIISSDTAPRASDIIIADLDKDGFNDIVLSSSKGILWVQSEGGKGWAEPARISSYAHSLYGALGADIDKDGDIDILYPNEKKVVAIISDGGAFTEKTLHDGKRKCSKLKVADINGDGFVDFVVSNGNEILYYENVEGKAFSSAVAVEAKSKNRLDIIDTSLGDFNGDGKMDIAVYRGKIIAFSHYVEDDTWTLDGSIKAERGLDNSSLIEAVDLNKDRALDLVTFDRLGTGPVWFIKNLNKPKK